MFNTMKRKMFFRLTAVCLMAVSVLIACTKDYGSDIKKLQDDMDKLSAQVSKLQECIDNGCVITDVTPIDNGVKVTLSNGKDPFYIYNGKDGKDGEVGDDGKDGKDGTVWKIGDNGNWWSSTEGQPFVDTGMASRGPKGDTGKSAYEVAKDNGFNGTEAEWLASLKGEPGDKGDTGDYYYPCTEKDSENYGKWIKVDGASGTPTVTDQYWLPEGTLTAVWNEDDQTLEIHNVEGAEEGIVLISLATSLTSLAVIPDLWDGNLGMPKATVYSLYPSYREFYKYMYQRGGENDAKSMRLMYMFNWNGVDYGVDPLNMGWKCFFATLWCTYLGKTNPPADNGYDQNYYMEGFDLTSPKCIWRDQKYRFSGWDEFSFEELVSLFDDLFFNDMASRLNALAEHTDFITRQFPVSPLNLKYRINPAGASLTDYQFNMIDRSLKVETKAEGDNRAKAVAKLEVEKASADQLNVTGYINYFKYFADQPYDWFMSMFGAKVARSWNIYGWKDGGWEEYLRNIPDGKKESVAQEVPYGEWSSGYYMDVRGLDLYMKELGINYETIVALEASKNGRGAEAIVSDYASVDMKFVSPIWTAYNHRCPERIVDQWFMPATAWNTWYNLNIENDFLVAGETYDVAAHMRFADPYYGRLESLGFKVKYEFYPYSAANSAPAHAWNEGTGNGTGNEVHGEGENTVWSAWDKINCTADGKVTVKTDEDGNFVPGAIGKFVAITADASIWNEATGTWYTSGCTGLAWPPFNNWNGMVDEFAAQYILLIVPNNNDCIEVIYDLGDVDYLALSKVFKSPAPIVSQDPGEPHDWSQALVMDMEGFNNVYKTDPTAPAVTGFSAQYAHDAAAMFTVTLSNQIALGPGTVTYYFTPDKNEYAPIKYTFKWNVVINWAETEPILHEDYILYDDNPANTKLTKTIINPDPATLDAWKDYRTVSTDLTKVPYVDSIVSVKGKKVGEGWKPQSSIKEHIHDYGQYLDLQANIADLSMSIDWANTKNSAGEQLATTSAEIITPDGAMAPTYKLQEILMKENFKAYEQYRDYLINITVKLKTGTSKVVKAYIVRFINPFKLKVTDVVLHTHREDWCAKRANIQLLDAQSGAVVYDFQTNVIDASYRDLYPGILEAIQDPANMPTWKIAEPLDPSFGEPGEFLRVDPTTGWFYWRNAGTNLQNDKTTTYEVRMNLPALAELADTGEITVLNVPHSYVFHKECDPDNPTPQPNENGRPVWEVVFN